MAWSSRLASLRLPHRRRPLLLHRPLLSPDVVGPTSTSSPPASGFHSLPLVPSSLLRAAAAARWRPSSTTSVPHHWRLEAKATRGFASETLMAAAAGGEPAAVVEVPLAQTGEGIAECELIQWFVREGDQVEEFQRLCEVQSDKATIEITSRFKGKVHQLHFGPGDIVKVGETLLKMLVDDCQAESHDTATSSSSQSHVVDASSSSNEGSVTGGVLSTPAVRHLAKQYGLNVNDVPGTGKCGRILKEDVLNYAVNKGFCKESPLTMNANIDKLELLEAGKSADIHTVGTDHYEDKTISLRGFQRSMVKSMSLAAKVPHFHYLEEINCDALVKLKASFQSENKDHNVKHTFLPFLVKSLSMALSKYPLLNSSFIEQTNDVVLKGCHNIGIAMATSYGLVVPNIKKVQSLSILEITKEVARLHEMASHNKLSTEDITGGTMTLTNIGAIGGKFGSPLLNLPEVAIIALGRIQKLPRFDADGGVYPASVINVTVGADHRVVDGATVAKFCNEWKSLVEKPELLLLHMK